MDDLLLLTRGRLLARSGEARRLREQAELSYRDMGLILGVAPSTVQRWEAGKRPRPDHARKWAVALATIAEELGE